VRGLTSLEYRLLGGKVAGLQGPIYTPYEIEFYVLGELVQRGLLSARPDWHPDHGVISVTQITDLGRLAVRVCVVEENA
jgi:hypothetical protein